MDIIIRGMAHDRNRSSTPRLALIKSFTTVDDIHHQCYFGIRFLMQSPGSMSSHSRSSSSSVSPSSSLSSYFSHDSSSYNSSLESPSFTLGRSFDKLSRSDQELMTQWCSSTYRLFCPRSTVQQFWQTVVPHESLQHLYLKHAMFALTSLHLAVLAGSGKRRQRYRKSAKAQRSQAVTSLQRIKTIDISNNVAVFAFNSIMMIFEFAYHLVKPFYDEDALDDLCESFLLTRNWITGVKCGLASDADSRLRPLIESIEVHPKMPDMSRLAILMLRRQNAALGGSEPQHETAIYEETIRHLGDSLENLSKGGEAMAIAFRWIHRIPVQFLDLVEERQPFALVILAHYTVIMYNLRDHWWMGDWGGRVLRVICQHLNPQWMQWITWVIDATGFCASEL